MGDTAEETGGALHKVKLEREGRTEHVELLGIQ